MHKDDFCHVFITGLSCDLFVPRDKLSASDSVVAHSPSLLQND